MDKTKFSFDLVDKYTPEDVIKKSLVQINDATQGYVKGILKNMVAQYVLILNRRDWQQP